MQPACCQGAARVPRGAKIKCPAAHAANLGLGQGVLLAPLSARFKVGTFKAEGGHHVHRIRILQPYPLWTA